jgi:hypothetical protein
VCREESTPPPGDSQFSREKISRGAFQRRLGSSTDMAKKGNEVKTRKKKKREEKKGKQKRKDEEGRR